MSQQILSELVANVAAVHVTIGQQVEPGTEVALLESMKMEIPVLAEAPGTVEAVHIAPGDLVQEGDSLIVLSD